MFTILICYLMKYSLRYTNKLRYTVLSMLQNVTTPHFKKNRAYVSYVSSVTDDPWLKSEIMQQPNSTPTTSDIMDIRRGIRRIALLFQTDYIESYIKIILENYDRPKKSNDSSFTVELLFTAEMHFFQCRGNRTPLLSRRRRSGI